MFFSAVYVLITNISGSAASAGFINEIKITDIGSTDSKRNCGTMDYLNTVYQKNPSYRKTLDELNEYAREFSRLYKNLC